MTQLRVRKVCKECHDVITDVGVIQCHAKNGKGAYTYSAYLNVLSGWEGKGGGGRGGEAGIGRRWGEGEGGSRRWEVEGGGGGRGGRRRGEKGGGSRSRGGERGRKRWEVEGGKGRENMEGLFKGFV